MESDPDRPVVFRRQRCAWTNRARSPKLDIGVEPTYTTRNLQELADTLAKEMGAGKAGKQAAAE